MSVYCGKCGNLIFVSNRPNWKTNPENPEFTCEKCNPGALRFGEYER